MGSPTAPAPMLPPEVRAQQPQPQQGGPVFTQGQNLQAGGPGDPTVMLEQKIGELEKWASDMMMIVDQVHKPLSALLVPIAQAGKALRQEVTKLKEQKGQGGPAAPAAGKSPPNPAEGVMQRQAA
jgi:hypothetical protein